MQCLRVEYSSISCSVLGWNIPLFHAVNGPIKMDPRRLDDGSGIEATLRRCQAQYHASRLLFSNTKLQRSEKKTSPATDENSSSGRSKIPQKCQTPNGYNVSYVRRRGMIWMTLDKLWPWNWTRETTSVQRLEWKAACQTVCWRCGGAGTEVPQCMLGWSREMLPHKSQWNGTFHDGCLEDAVPSSLLQFVCMIELCNRRSHAPSQQGVVRHSLGSNAQPLTCQARPLPATPKKS